MFLPTMFVFTVIVIAGIIVTIFIASSAITVLVIIIEAESWCKCYYDYYWASYDCYHCCCSRSSYLYMCFSGRLGTYVCVSLNVNCDC